MSCASTLGTSPPPLSLPPRASSLARWPRRRGTGSSRLLTRRWLCSPPPRRVCAAFFRTLFALFMVASSPFSPIYLLSGCRVILHWGHPSTSRERELSSALAKAKGYRLFRAFDPSVAVFASDTPSMYCFLSHSFLYFFHSISCASESYRRGTATRTFNRPARTRTRSLTQRIPCAVLSQ